MKTLYYGDNLEILRNKIPDNSVDLCYIDPPFNSKKSYFQIYNNIGGSEDKAQAQAFTDTWTWDDRAIEGHAQILENYQGRFTRQSIELIKGLEIILKKGALLAYLVHMTLRVTEIFRVLKPTGSFYLHCDPTASHYLKLVLDAIFVSQGGNYQNEIVWKRSTSGSSKSVAQRFGSDHDVIFYYVKSNLTTFNKVYMPYPDKEIKKRFRRSDAKGRYKDAELATYSEEKLEELKKDNRLIVNGSGKLRYKIYLDDIQGVLADDVWIDIPPINSQAAERLGYPTQKPEALMERIIKASSKEGDVVLDAYCGCGTTVAVAHKLNRQWIGIDITYHSISLILKRLVDAYGERIMGDIRVDGIPQDMAAARALANRDDDRVRKEFEKWAVLTYTNNRAVINDKKGADKGIDGVVYFAIAPGQTARMVIQVKSGGANRGTIATLHGDMEREKAELATLITMDEPTKPMIEEAKSVGVYEHSLMGRCYDRIRIVTVREMIEQGTRLDLPLSFDAVKQGKKTTDSPQLPMDL